MLASAEICLVGKTGDLDPCPNLGRCDAVTHFAVASCPSGIKNQALLQSPQRPAALPPVGGTSP